MSKRGCSCGIEMTVTMLIGIASGCIVGFVLGWLWRDRPGAIADVSLLNVMTAFGTVGATLAAVIMPALERRRRRAEIEAEDAKANWLTGFELRNHVETLKTFALTELVGDTRPSLEQIDVLLRQFQMLKLRVRSTEGTALITDAIELVNQMHAWVAREKGMEPLFSPDPRIYEPYQQAIDILLEAIEGWFDVLARTRRRLGIEGF